MEREELNWGEEQNKKEEGEILTEPTGLKIKIEGSGVTQT